MPRYLILIQVRRLALFGLLLVDNIGLTVAAGDNGISWAAVGISWVLSTVTTILILLLSYGIKSFRRKNSNRSFPATEDDAANDAEKTNLTSVASTIEPGYKHQPNTRKETRENSTQVQHGDSHGTAPTQASEHNNLHYRQLGRSRQSSLPIDQIVSADQTRGTVHQAGGVRREGSLTSADRNLARNNSLQRTQRDDFLAELPPYSSSMFEDSVASSERIAAHPIRRSDEYLNQPQGRVQGRRSRPDVRNVRLQPAVAAAQTSRGDKRTFDSRKYESSPREETIAYHGGVSSVRTAAELTQKKGGLLFQPATSECAVDVTGRQQDSDIGSRSKYSAKSRDDPESHRGEVHRAKNLSEHKDASERKPPAVPQSDLSKSASQSRKPKTRQPPPPINTVRGQKSDARQSSVITASGRRRSLERRQSADRGSSDGSDHDLGFMAPGPQQTSTPGPSTPTREKSILNKMAENKETTNAVQSSSSETSSSTSEDETSSEEETSDEEEALTSSSHKFQVSDSGLQNISSMLGQDWRRLAEVLSVPHSRVEQISSRHSSSQSKSYELLKQLRDGNRGGEQLTRRSLIDALISINRKDIADKLINRSTTHTALTRDKLISVV